MSNIIKLNACSSQKLVVKLKNDFDDLSDSEKEQDHFSKKLQQNYDNGYAEGYKTARAELEKSFNEKINKKVDDFNSILKSVDDKLSEYDEEFDKLVVHLSFEIASKIIRKEVEKDSNIEGVLKESLRKILGANNIIIKIHPEDHKAIINNNSKNTFSDDSVSKVKFEVDERIEKGGCVVETEIGNVDGRISSQLNELKKYFEPVNEY